ncbi:MAG TPA: Ig-like domain-containing protein, partial [Urbifossiella sp.]|nr:Ig-like domain-containing protein [Urbifossiella sp.]
MWDAVTGARVSDSGDALEQLTALLGPARFNSDNGGVGAAFNFDTRSDNKGPEPESVAVGVIDGRTYAFVGLERFGGVAVFDVSDSVAPKFTDFLDTPGDVAPEGLIFIPAADSPTGRAAVVVANEVSGTVTMYDAAFGAYTLQLLHASDLEPGIAAGDDAPRFAAVVDYLERDLFAANDPRKQAFAGSVLLSSGDNFIAGPFYAAGGDPSLNTVLNSNPTGVNGDVASPGRAGIEIMNRIGFDASALGNHEFDQGQRELRNVIQPQAGQTSGANAPAPARQWRGATFPYLSANLSFTGTDLSGSIAPGGVSTTGLAAGRIAPSAIIDADGDGPGTEFVGVIGITTPLLAAISSPGNVGVSPTGVTGNLTPAQLQQLAGIVQAQVTILEGLGIDKIILLSHLQQFSEEQALAGLLRGVDVIIAGGSDTRLADNTDILRAGDAAEGQYPVAATGADGNPLLLVSTDGNFSYVGRLVLTFDANGVIQTNALSANVNGAYSADQAGVERLYGAGAVAEVVSPKAAAVKQVTDAVDAVITLKDSTLFGRSDVYLNGLRAEVRTEETNLGNLSADANLLAAQQFDTSAVPTTVSIKNGGGIRDSVGSVDSTTGARGPTAANPDAGKLAGQVSDLDIENALRFNNTLSVVTVTAAQVKLLLEHAVAATAAGATPGQFAQVGGIRYSFDTAGAPLVATGNAGIGIATFAGGTRVRNAAIVDDAGNVIDVLVQNGVVVGDPARLVRVVTLSFLVDDGDGNGLGGDNYPFPTFGAQLGAGVFERVNLTEGAAPLGEQRAAELYFQQEFPAGGPAYAEADTPAARDTRIQNLAARADTVLLGLAVPAPVTTAEDTPATALGVAPTTESGAGVTHVLVTNVVGGVLGLDGDILVTPGTFLTVEQAAALRFIPAADFTGAASFQVQAATGANPLALVGAVQTVAITVTPVNDAPVAVADAYPVTPGSRLTVGTPGVFANDTDVEGTTLTAELVAAMPATEGRVALGANGSLVFTPAAGFAGTTSFIYRVSDGVAFSAPATVTLTVAAPADPVPSLIDPNTGAPAAGFTPFPGANVPVDLAVGDVTGDGTADLIAGAGVGGGPVIKVFDGATD